MKKLFLITLVFLPSISIFAQLSKGGEPRLMKHKDISPLLTANCILAQPNLTEAINYDNSPNNMYKTRRFGVIIPINKNFFSLADMVEIDNGKLWYLKLSCKQAQALNLYSNNFFLPKGSELFIYSPSTNQVIGRFDSDNNS